jgi:hypothetical protein
MTTHNQPHSLCALPYLIENFGVFVWATSRSQRVSMVHPQRACGGTFHRCHRGTWQGFHLDLHLDVLHTTSEDCAIGQDG